MLEHSNRARAARDADLTGRARRKLSTERRAAADAIRELRERRAAARSLDRDSIEARRPGCAWMRLRDRRALAAITAQVERNARETEREVAERAAAKLVRDDLLRAARAGRSLGWSVQASKFDGRVSSYYMTVSVPGSARSIRLRVSDHDVPVTQTREARAELDGCVFDGSADLYAEPIVRTIADWRELLSRTAEARMVATES